MRRLLIAVALAAAVAGCSSTAPPPPAPPAASATVTTPSPALITMPNVVGMNAAVAVDKLKKLGFKQVDLGTVDRRPLVILPQNWTVKTQSAQPGDRLAADDKVVLGCARNG